jgi:thiol-disulfide isomerase/thioredoxin
MRKRVTSLLFAAFFCLFTHPGRAGDAVGDLAPNWILPDTTGTPISLYEEAEAGKTIVMFFWASWCKSCKSLLPVLQKLDEAKGERPISFYLMNVWEDDDPVAFLKRYDLELPVLLQAENVAQRYDIRITPGVVVVDPERRIRYVRTPNQSVAEVTAELQRVLDLPVTTAAMPVTPADETTTGALRD